MKIIALNLQPFDAVKHDALPVIADAKIAAEQIAAALKGWKADAGWTKRAQAARQRWLETADAYQAVPEGEALPTDAQVIGAAQRVAKPTDTVVCAAGGYQRNCRNLAA